MRAPERSHVLTTKGRTMLTDHRHPEADDTPISYGIAEVCRRSGFGKTFVYAEIEAGRLRTFKAGRRRMALHEDVAEWIHRLASRDAA